jgi:hypothetical protein
MAGGEEVAVLSLATVLRDGLILSFLSSAVLIALLRINPRLLMHDYPAPIQALAPPKTAQEKRQGLLLGWPFLIILVAVPLWSTLRLQQAAGGDAPFLDLFLNSFGVVLTFNLVDLLILDWGMFCTLTPHFLVIPGTEGAPAYKDYMFHLRAFMIGTVYCLVGALVLAALVAVAG